MDLPLSINGTFTHWVQLGTSSQFKIFIDLKQSEKYIKENKKTKNAGMEEQGLVADKDGNIHE